MPTTSYLVWLAEQSSQVLAMNMALATGLGRCHGNGPTEASTVQVPSLPHHVCGTGELQDITPLQLPYKETQKIVS